jgi:hypothetical protein
MVTDCRIKSQRRQRSWKTELGKRSSTVAVVITAEPFRSPNVTASCVDTEPQKAWQSQNWEAYLFW